MTTAGSSDFIDLVRDHLDVGDRVVRFNNVSRLAGVRYDTIYINFFNLPEEVVARREGGGAEAENNRMMFTVSGFGRETEHSPPPTGKVKVELTVSAFPRSLSMRAKTGTPEAVAKYLAAFLNKVVAEVEPHYTHTRR